MPLVRFFKDIRQNMAKKRAREAVMESRRKAALKRSEIPRTTESAYSDGSSTLPPRK